MAGSWWQSVAWQGIGWAWRLLDHHLAPRQKELLQYLARNAGRVCSDDELIEKVWLGADVQNNTVAGAIGRRCKKLVRVSSGASDYIERIDGRGYRLKKAPS
jgi:DNA-binding response OmpR family regulator